jgi:hypothetical protein
LRSFFILFSCFNSIQSKKPLKYDILVFRVKTDRLFVITGVPFVITGKYYVQTIENQPINQMCLLQAGVGYNRVAYNQV